MAIRRDRRGTLDYRQDSANWIEQSPQQLTFQGLGYYARSMVGRIYANSVTARVRNERTPVQTFANTQVNASGVINDRAVDLARYRAQGTKGQGRYVR